MAGHESLHLAGVVAASGEGGADHLQKAKLLFTDAAVNVELLRWHEAIHGQVFRAGRELLADGDDVNPMVPQVPQGADHFFVTFPQAHHQS